MYYQVNNIIIINLTIKGLPSFRIYHYFICLMLQMVLLVLEYSVLLPQKRKLYQGWWELMIIEYVE